jgi:hypothetical protein
MAEHLRARKWFNRTPGHTWSSHSRGKLEGTRILVPPLNGKLASHLRELVNFKDMNVNFTLEQCALQNPSRKNLHRDV